MVYSRLMGARVKRQEDPRLIIGRGRFVDDFQPRGLAYMTVLRSPHGHARIKGIDTASAKRLPGVIAVVTGAELQAMAGPMPFGGGEGGGGPKGMAPIPRVIPTRKGPARPEKLALAQRTAAADSVPLRVDRGRGA